jgi:hypothetical protein
MMFIDFNSKPFEVREVLGASALRLTHPTGNEEPR